jgi:DNA-binding NarL/FixJ family response regulator
MTDATIALRQAERMAGSQEAAPVPAPVRVLVADDDERFRQALSVGLNSVGFFEVVGLARDGREAVELCRALDPDILVLDIVMPHCDGIEAIRQLDEHRCRAAVVILSASDDVRAFSTCLALGATGCARKDKALSALLPLFATLAAYDEDAARQRPSGQAC